MSRPVCGNCMCLEDETGCGCSEDVVEYVCLTQGAYIVFDKDDPRVNMRAVFDGTTGELKQLIRLN